MLSRSGIGQSNDSLTESLARNNAIVDRWQDELRQEIDTSAFELPHLLDNALQARNMSVIWQCMTRIPSWSVTNPFDETQQVGSLHNTSMMMFINTRVVPGPERFLHRMHVIPHNAGLMFHELILLPFSATPTHVIDVIKRHTLPMGIIP
jgi:hypothetical protein